MLLEGRRLRGKRRALVAAAIGHAISFPTWRSLARDQGLSDAEAGDVMAAAVEAAATMRA